ncbi:KEOPS complex subunit Pcc1 [Haloquadratum walsbyi]|jgi:hypothetical protein|uniref:Uncharacterized protein n=1 Tax=Haloquadratum walsbyi J07HQW2 TaxID=1238425 RepID=U1PLE9_9EURY|nr:KEOPS complex subunit Pcc1 [Haloquadratum walsbyi]ERG94522.1 MAG: hypothetical protein J07HQW2_00956 [Haloquadratum walsbyi J07HQW2]
MRDNDTGENQGEKTDTYTANADCEHKDDNNEIKYRADDQQNITDDDGASMDVTQGQDPTLDSDLDSESLSTPSSTSMSIDTESHANADPMKVSRTAQLETTHTDIEVVAAALRPDNTASMSMTVDKSAETLQTTITRETTGGVQSTVDDTIVNLTVADAIITAVEQCRTDRTKSKSQSQS